MPAGGLGAARNAVTSGTNAAARAYVLIAALVGLALVALTRWRPAPISLTPEEKTAIPPTAVALGAVVLGSAILVGIGSHTRVVRTTIVGYAGVVMGIPLLAQRLPGAGGG